MSSVAAQRAETSDAATEQDMDSLHILPLSIIPLSTNALKQARLIKNRHFESVVEIFNYPGSGSGQIAPDALAKHFHWKSALDFEDQRIIEHLAQLNSYDVYSLRIELRRMGIKFEEFEALCLSKAKQAELTEYMRVFTSPLLAQVYGELDVEIKNFDQLVAMFSNSDRESVMHNLHALASKLEIDTIEVPEFLEDYADVFLSLAYYRSCLDALVPKISRFVEAMAEIQNGFPKRVDPALMHLSGFLRERVNDVSASLTGRFESFDRHSKNMWENLNGQSFRRVRKLIESHHTTVGGVLCGLSLKLNAWEEEVGWKKNGLMQGTEYTFLQMCSGMNRIKQIEDSAPSISDP